ncbi:MAG: GWxTD domain-containing protein, partial [Acidobacteriia bacterium]|nr:GWxTD domain-containing protein [Terriglobia bacterium]
QNLGIYMQVYNLSLDPKTHRPSADIQYEILKDGKALLTTVEHAGEIANSAQQMTLQKTMPLKSLPPGKYTVQIKVTDKVKNQTVSPEASFELR